MAETSQVLLSAEEKVDLCLVLLIRFARWETWWKSSGLRAAGWKLSAASTFSTASVLRSAFFYFLIHFLFSFSISEFISLLLFFHFLSFFTRKQLSSFVGVKNELRNKRVLRKHKKEKMNWGKETS